MNKKLIMIVAVLAMGTMMLAACGGSKTEEAETTVSDVVTEATQSESQEITESEDIIPEDSEGIEEIPVEDEEAAEDEELIDDAVEANPLMPMIDKVLSESEWPAMAEVTDSVILNEFFLLDPTNENFSEMIVMQCPISAVMSEIIVIRSDDIAAAEEALKARQTKAIEQDAWYPNDQELAAASIVGTNGSYAYFIIGENAEAAEKSINDYIDSLA